MTLIVLPDQPAKVRFVARLRGEERFGSVDQLVAQMTRDVDEARSVLTGAGPTRLERPAAGA